MHFSSIVAASALAATAFAAPQRPGQYGQPGRPGRPTTTAAATPTTTEAPIETEDPSISVDPITPTTSATVTYPAGNDTIPGPTGTVIPVPPRCLTDEDAENAAYIFQTLIQNYSDDFALEFLTEDFVDWSSSVNILMNQGAQYPKNITGPTFASRAEFIEGQGAQPLIPFEVLNVFHGCDSVTVRWLTTDSAAGKPTRVATIPAVGNGIMRIDTTQTDNEFGFRVKELFSEWNTAAWFVNLGWFTPNGTVDYVNTNSTVKRSVQADARPWGNMI